MSDSFADLWNSAAPSKPKPPPQRLGSLSAQLNPPPPSNTQSDLFAQLSSRAYSTSDSRPTTPSSGPPNSRQKSYTKAPTQNTNGDAFSGLFTGSSLAENRSTANMTIAERAALVEKKRLEQTLKQRQTPAPTLDAWDGLDSLGNKTFATSSTVSSPVPKRDWGHEASEVLKSVALPSQLKSEPDWGLADFANTPSPVTITKSGTFWNMDEFSVLDSQTRALVSGGGEEYAAPTDGPDDILGDLSRPVEAIQRERSHTSAVVPTRSSPASHFNPSRSNSPPPHILGQLIEMGFSVNQARTALASTDSGLDLNAALEILISNGVIGASEDEDKKGQSSTSGKSQNKRTPSPQEVPKVRPRRDRQIAQQRQRERERNTSSFSDQGGLQADKILAQASEIGFSLFNRANAAWKEGKERVQKVYEEKVTIAATAEGSNSKRGSGRSTPMATKPKWMQDSENLTSVMDSIEKNARSTQESPVSIPRTEVVDLFYDTPDSSSSHLMSHVASSSTGSSDGVYVSKFRHVKPNHFNQISVSISSPPVPPHPITTVSASESTIALSQESKASGTHFFKLGDFSAADTAYTRAIEVLPDGHALLIPLYNNRALVRLKVGDVQGVVADTGNVEKLIGGVDNVRNELKKGNRGKIAVQGTASNSEVVNIADALVKAWKRRAEAMEGREKWEDASKYWEKVACAEWAGQHVRAEGASAAARCRKMQQQGSAQYKPKSKTQPPVRPQPPGLIPLSKALGSLRAANEAAESEDSQRYALKDSVEEKLQTWKAGKENNIRALLASLDTILWPQSGVQKLSMAELINEGQVKMKYMKSIAKVHPDKLNAGNSTLEQRMIAAGVFSALNEAWNAFRL